MLRAPWEGNTGAVSNIVTRYAGHSVDTAVGRHAARHGKKAQGCWAGTTVDDIRLDFHVARVAAKTLDGQPTQIPLAYATHTMSSWKPTVKTYRGTIGNQDAFYCTKPPMTKLTLTAANCTGCQVDVMNGALRVENTWAAEPKTMKNGQVTFRVPRNLTRGITTTVYAPWEGNTGYTALVAWRYAGQQIGDAVSLKTARAATHGSACWGGTSSTSLAIPLTIRKVRTGGNTGPTNGTLAYAQVTQAWLKPRMQADHGDPRHAGGHHLPEVTCVDRASTPRRNRTRRGVVLDRLDPTSRNIAVTRLRQTAHAWASRKTSCCGRSRSVTSGSCDCGSPTCSGS